jgi:uncharacterized protein YndB with AHSA1/START domain
MSDSMTKDAIVIERTFDAPIELMWQLWTQPEHLKNWYGPQGFSLPHINFDTQVGGKRLMCMEGPTPNGPMKVWLTGEFTEIVPNKRLVYTDCPSDENGNLVILEGDTEPLITVVTVEFEDLGDRTKMVMTHAGLPANEQGASAGWEQAANKLANYAETLRNN